MELTPFEQELIEKWRAYESTLDPQELSDASADFMEAVMVRFNADGLDSVWYGRVLDRPNGAQWFPSVRSADDATLVGLVFFLNRWAESTYTTVVRVED